MEITESASVLIGPPLSSILYRTRMYKNAPLVEIVSTFHEVRTHFYR